jgi:transposase-like protein
MPKRKIDVIEDVKKKYVRMALETGNITSTARKAGISNKTLKVWMNEYEDVVREQMEDEGSTSLSENPTKDELAHKYEQAMKLLGEKELEVAMLKNLLKKNESR